MKRQKRIQSIRLSGTLRWRLTLFVLIILLTSGLLTLTTYLFITLVFHSAPLILALTLNPLSLIIVFLLVCTLIGTVLANWLGIYYLHPLKKLIKATKEVKKGNFKVQIQSGKNNPHSEMGMLITSFNEMVQELDGIELFRNDFINNFSHEFKTPIVSIRGFAKELQLGDLTPEQRREYAKIIAEEADRLAKLSTSVLELSKVENQQIITDKTEFSLDEQLRRCILLLEPGWSEKEIEIIPELDEVKIYSNEELLSHIWKNLIGNAIKFTPKGGMVRISLTADESNVTVQIADTGIGMTEEVKNHIFEKFYQGDPSHHRKGYGIGLTLVDRVVKLCGGSIRVDSETNRGSTFTVTLPYEKQPEVIVAELQSE
ncbi:MAG: HAMP domain-containing histidine kinase [Clostridia bacterium]|nr:HAMP domain-containing histidine kinase [Clostridia bacterium]